MDCIATFCAEKQLSQSTENLYRAVVKMYEKVNNQSLDDLIEEADREEDQGIRWKKRQLKTRLLNFRKVLYETKSEGTALRYLTCIKTVYRHFEIEMQKLPSFNSHQIDKTYEKTFEDIPSKEELIDAYYEANNVCKCIILFASSSGLSKVDMLNLTVDDFINAVGDVEDGDLISQLQSLKKRKNIIPVFEGCRQKTTSKYTTFCSSEASEHIIQYLIGRDAQIREEYNSASEEEAEDLNECLYREDSLFDISESHLSYSFRKINAKLGLGKVGKWNKFRCHQLRAFQASALMNEGGFTIDEIDAIQGRKKDKTHRAYFMESKSKLYDKYCENVDCLMLFKNSNVSVEEYNEIKSQNEAFKQEIAKSEKKMEEQQKTIEQIIANQRELEALLGL